MLTVVCVDELIDRVHYGDDVSRIGEEDLMSVAAIRLSSQLVADFDPVHRVRLALLFYHKALDALTRLVHKPKVVNHQ